ncbi:hypothetical protein ACWDBO_37280 [Streptomyces mirabilis]|uniref:hypothetical protein n=1 Tax=Streptomyces mirabilis TaxID=68239 RepID=UPI0033290615
MRASLIAARGQDLDVLVDLLADRDVHDLWVIKNVAGDGLIFDPAPDIVVGALDAQDASGSVSSQEGFNNFDVLLRLGQAVSRGIPSLLIVPPPLKPPNWIRGLSVALCAPDNRPALEDHIWALTANISRRSERKDTSDKFTPVDVSRYLSKLQEVERTYHESLPFGVGPPRVGQAYAEFEHLISELLVAAGAALAERPESARRDDYADFAFIPSGGSSVVVLAECKLVSRKRRLHDDEAILRQKVSATHSQLGLLIYHSIDGTEPTPSRYPTALVERISAKDLIERLGGSPLPKVISDAVAQAAARS